ncbi:MvdC/MvdD family ATP grasp protein [Thermobifida cellulosilytica]|uniref:MvdD-like pre-ATP grasp domain-containing protein n=1 Tax=Thermobifida cellulosilytica TB100 TaxID=665004 RepID=A0A147KFC6_THECS|nr:ATP-grasp ribosomal peptide maturase [Thermobifida cellulosilytica]KUP95992.1 hypothetical protein AC529_14360 [Thermobifida cellulosilytica TB100]
MGEGATVLVLAPADDGEANQVTTQLTRRGVAFFRLDTAAFPTSCTVTAELGPSGWHGTVTTPEGTLDLGAVEAVLYRQPSPFGLPAGLNPSERRFAQVEARFGLGGLLASLPARWVPGTPGRVADAEYKPLQLAAAVRCGLTPPPTLATNSPDAARSFTARHDGGAVYKAFMHKAVADDGSLALIYTSPVDPATVDRRVASTMHQFQANLAARKRCDVRVLANRHRHAAVAILSTDPHARQDFRSRYDALVYRPVDVPPQVAEGCRRYLHALDLRLGVFDFCVTDDDQWYFLECGPGAQWAWLAEEVGQAMSDLVADALLEELS